MSQQVRVSALFRDELDLDRLCAALVELVIQLREQKEGDAEASTSRKDKRD